MNFRLVDSSYDIPFKYLPFLNINGFKLKEKNGKIYIKINTINDLKILSQLCDQDLVIQFNIREINDENCIVICDGWLE